MAELATNIPPKRIADRNAVLQLAVFTTSVDNLRHYAKWARGSHPHQGVVVEACLLHQNLAQRDDSIAALVQLGFDPSRLHMLDDDGVRDPDLYVDPFDGGIGADGAYAVPNLGDKALYLFDNISVTDGDKPAKDKLYRLMRLLAGIPRQRGFAVLFECRGDRICFAQHCIGTLNAHQRDRVISEALDDLRGPSQY